MTDEELAEARQKYAAMSLEEKTTYYEKISCTRNVALSEAILDMAVEYELQALRYGDLTNLEKQRLAAIGQNPDMLHKATQSLVLRRLYKGKVYEVERMPDGQFRYENQSYTSLSAIAKEITGCHMSGIKFFSNKRVD